MHVANCELRLKAKKEAGIFCVIGNWSNSAQPNNVDFRCLVCVRASNVCEILTLWRDSCSKPTDVFVVKSLKIWLQIAMIRSLLVRIMYI